MPHGIYIPSRLTSMLVEEDIGAEQAEDTLDVVRIEVDEVLELVWSPSCRSVFPTCSGNLSLASSRSARAGTPPRAR